MVSTYSHTLMHSKMWLLILQAPKGKSKLTCRQLHEGSMQTIACDNWCVHACMNVHPLFDKLEWKPRPISTRKRGGRGNCKNPSPKEPPAAQETEGRGEERHHTGPGPETPQPPRSPWDHPKFLNQRVIHKQHAESLAPDRCRLEKKPLPHE